MVVVVVVVVVVVFPLHFPLEGSTVLVGKALTHGFIVLFFTGRFHAHCKMGHQMYAEPKGDRLRCCLTIIFVHPNRGFWGMIRFWERKGGKKQFL